MKISFCSPNTSLMTAQPLWHVQHVGVWSQWQSFDDNNVSFLSDLIDNQITFVNKAPYIRINLRPPGSFPIANTSCAVMHSINHLFFFITQRLNLYVEREFPLQVQFFIETTPMTQAPITSWWPCVTNANDILWFMFLKGNDCSMIPFPLNLC